MSAPISSSTIPQTPMYPEGDQPNSSSGDVHQPKHSGPEASATSAAAPMASAEVPMTLTVREKHSSSIDDGLNSGAQQLVERNSRERSHLRNFVQGQSNAQRMRERELTSDSKPFAEYGKFAGGRGDYAGFAIAQGRNSETAFEGELVSGSVQVGVQNEAQVTGVRLGVSSEDGTNSAQVRAAEAIAHIGLHNSDGSIGLNAGASATAVGAEVTVGHSGNSATVGASAGYGVDGSIGLRDADDDGHGEVCVRATAEAGIGGTVGLCVEPPGVSRAVGTLYEKLRAQTLD